MVRYSTWSDIRRDKIFSITSAQLELQLCNLRSQEQNRPFNSGFEQIARTVHILGAHPLNDLIHGWPV